MKGKLMLGILILTCLSWNSMARRSRHDEFQPLIRNVVDDPKLNASHISGPNGFCIDIKDSNYNDGNSIIIWHCSSHQAGQIWTFESDGTVRSKGKCLTTNGYEQGSEIMIHNCSSAIQEATIWELKGNGMIMNPKSQLVLTAMLGTVGTTLTVEFSNVSSSYQTWRVGNNTQPRLVLIKSYYDRCLQADSFGATLQLCDSGIVDQQWLLYPDGTIRSKKKPELCLNYVSPAQRWVRLLSCGLEPSSQRWLFHSYHTILNERDNLVVSISEVRRSDIIVRAPTRDTYQMWKTEPLHY